MYVAASVSGNRLCICMLVGGPLNEMVGDVARGVSHACRHGLRPYLRVRMSHVPVRVCVVGSVD